jgi:hypothetical protein
MGVSDDGNIFGTISEGGGSGRAGTVFELVPYLRKFPVEMARICLRLC